MWNFMHAASWLIYDREFEDRERDIYRHNMTFEMPLFFWNFCECNVYYTFCIVYFTLVYYLLHLLWQC